jgi:hypothetical protein
MNIRLAQAAVSLIPGNTIEEKISWLQSHLDTELGEMYASGKLTRADIYRLMSGDLKQSDDETKKLLTPYLKQVSELRKLATQLATSSADPDTVIVKLLQRKNEVLVKQLKAFYASSKRTEEVFTPLLSVEDKEQVAVIQKFVSEEISAKRLDIKADFLELANSLLKQFPLLNMDDILTIIKKYTNNKTASNIRTLLGMVGVFSSGESTVDKLSDEELVNLYEQIHSFRYKIFTAGQAKIRPWNAILAQNPNQQGADLYKQLIKEPIVWRLDDVLEKTGVDFSNTISDYIEYYAPDEVGGEPLDTPEKKKDYQSKQFKKAVLNGYDNEHILPLIGMDFETIIDDFGKEKRVSRKVDSKALDTWGKLVKYYYEYLMNNSLPAFISELDRAGLNYVTEIINSAYLVKKDERYKEFSFNILSSDEGSMLETLRNEFKLDAIPMPLSMKVPQGCPTNSSFLIDFTIPSDILESFDVNGQPVIKRKVVLVGEYFGFSGGEPVMVGFDADVDWSKPDGSQFTYKSDESDQTPATPGSMVPGKDLYALRSEWKVFTQNILGHLFSTAALHFDKQDLLDTNNAAKKLNTKSIIFHYAKQETACTALNRIKVHMASCPDANACPGKEYLNAEQVLTKRYESPEEMQINIIDAYIQSIKVSEGLKDTITNFTGAGSFNRQNGHAHTQYMLQLEAEREALMESPTPQNIKRLQDVNIEIRTMKNSPLYDFKTALDNTLKQEKYVSRIDALENLKALIQSGQAKMQMMEVRNLITDIMRFAIPSNLSRRTASKIIKKANYKIKICR